MIAADTPAAKVRAWAEGVFAQASHPRSAARTRLFVANEDRLAELFPDEHRESVRLLVGLLVDPLCEGSDPATPGAEAHDDAEAICRLIFGVLRGHLFLRTRPTASEVAHLVRFFLRGAGVDEPDGTVEAWL